MIAITGANGLLGSFIASQFVSEGENVIALTRTGSNTSSLQHLDGKIQMLQADVLDPDSLTTAFKDVDTVIHTAAIVSFNPRKSKEIFDTNVIGTRNVVDTCLSVGVKKLIHISSVAALGRLKGVNTINENAIWQDSALNSDYATSKYEAELEVYRGQEEGLNVSMVNPSVILAPGDWNRSSSQIFKYIWEEKPFYTTGIMNYIDARDVALMVSILHRHNFNGERFIASANHISFKEIFEEVAKRFNKKAPFIHVNSSLTGMVAFMEAIRCRLTNQEPVITKHTVRLAREPFYYENKKAIEKLNMNFRTLSETLDFCCRFYDRNVTTNK